MGAISELVIAGIDEAASIAASDCPTRSWKGIVWRTIDPVKLGTLWGILSGAAEEQVTGLISQIRLVHGNKKDGPWVHHVPEKLRDLLADLAGQDESEILVVSSRWAATDELQGWDPANVEALLRDVADTADTARLQKKQLLLWITL